MQSIAYVYEEAYIAGKLPSRLHIFRQSWHKFGTTTAAILFLLVSIRNVPINSQIIRFVTAARTGVESRFSENLGSTPVIPKRRRNVASCGCEPKRIVEDDRVSVDKLKYFPR